MVLVLPLAALVSCGSPKTFDDRAVRVVHLTHKEQRPMEVNIPNAAADMAIRQMHVGLMFAEAVAAERRRQVLTYLNSRRPTVTERAPNPVVTVGATASHSPWACISTAETGGRGAMGPTYWTQFGMVTDIIREYGTPAEQQHVFAGTASYDEQVDIGARFAADHGFSGWGVLTKQKCGLT